MRVYILQRDLVLIRFRIHSQTDAGRTAAGFVDKQVGRMLCYTSRSDDPQTHYKKTEKNRVLHGEDSIVVSTVNDSECE